MRAESLGAAHEGAGSGDAGKGTASRGLEGRQPLRVEVYRSSFARPFMPLVQKVFAFSSSLDRPTCVWAVGTLDEHDKEAVEELEEIFNNMPVRELSL